MTFNNLCNSCTNIGCEFQSGIVRTKCAFYIPPHIESNNCRNYVVMQLRDLNIFGRYKDISIRVRNDATNGDVIKALFQDEGTPELALGNIVCYGDANYDKDWWNAPYRAESNEPTGKRKEVEEE